MGRKVLLHKIAQLFFLKIDLSATIPTPINGVVKHMPHTYFLDV